MCLAWADELRQEADGPELSQPTHSGRTIAPSAVETVHDRRADRRNLVRGVPPDEERSHYRRQLLIDVIR
jgi:hypothetical protein